MILYPLTYNSHTLRVIYLMNDIQQSTHLSDPTSSLSSGQNCPLYMPRRSFKAGNPLAVRLFTPFLSPTIPTGVAGYYEGRLDRGWGASRQRLSSTHFIEQVCQSDQAVHSDPPNSTLTLLCEPSDVGGLVCQPAPVVSPTPEI